MQPGSSSPRAHENHASKYASRVLRDRHALVAGTRLSEDYRLLTHSALYLKGFVCQEDDLSVLQDLAADLDRHAASGDAGFIEWSRHQKHEDPDAISPTFRRVVALMAQYFDVEVYATRLNYYADGSAWKPFHHDSHAGRAFFEHGGQGPREDFTMGASFGAPRELAFMHVESDARFSFPQHNGDVFAFTAAVNAAFQHGVPKSSTTAGGGPRFSIIAWGRRVRLTCRNGALPEEIGTRNEVGQLVFPPNYQSYLSSGYGSKSAGGAKKENQRGDDAAEVSAKVEKFVGTVAAQQEKSARSTGKNGRQRNARIKK